MYSIFLNSQAPASKAEVSATGTRLISLVAYGPAPTVPVLPVTVTTTMEPGPCVVVDAAETRAEKILLAFAARVDLWKSRSSWNVQ